MNRDFTEEEVLRDSRNIVLPGIGVEGQRRLRDFRAFVLEAGGIGSPAILCRCGAERPGGNRAGGYSA